MIFGSRNEYAMSMSRLIRQKAREMNSTPPCTTGKSLCLMASTIRRPTPLMEKMVSQSTAPPRRLPNWMPTTVTMGTSAFRST